MEHHNLDTHPIPKESKPLFINEPWLIDLSLQWRQSYNPAPLNATDNISVYDSEKFPYTTIEKLKKEFI